MGEGGWRESGASPEGARDQKDSEKGRAKWVVRERPRRAVNIRTYAYRRSAAEAECSRGEGPCASHPPEELLESWWRIRHQRASERARPGDSREGDGTHHRVPVREEEPGILRGEKGRSLPARSERGESLSVVVAAVRERKEESACPQLANASASAKRGWYGDSATARLHLASP